MFWLTRVQSHSMAPTLRDGALALTRRLWRRTPVRRGDVVVVDSRELGQHVVKRIVGLPGETVSIEAGQVRINGQPLAEPYASRSVFTGAFQKSYVVGALLVPGALLGAGYTLESVELWDLFAGSHHVETLASFRRPAP